jgi:hypothetical protein
MKLQAPRNDEMKDALADTGDERHGWREYRDDDKKLELL